MNAERATRLRAYAHTRHAMNAHTRIRAYAPYATRLSTRLRAYAMHAPTRLRA